MIKKSSIIFSLLVLLYANSFFAASKIDSIQTSISLPTIIATENVVISDETSSNALDLEVSKEESAVFIYNGAFVFDNEKVSSSKYVYLDKSDKKASNTIKKEELKRTITLKEKHEEIIKEKASKAFIANPQSSQSIFCNVTADILFFISHSHHVLKNEAIFQYSLPNIQTYFYSEKISDEGFFISSLFSHYYFLRPPPSI